MLHLGHRCRVSLYSRASLCRHVRLGEVAEAGVVWSGQHLVVRGFEGLRARLGEHLFELILENHVAGDGRTLGRLHPLLSWLLK